MFPPKVIENKKKFAINKIFSIFIAELEKQEDPEFFVFFTNAELNVTDKNQLKVNKQMKESYPLEFVAVDIKKAKYQNLNNWPFINKNRLYEFAESERLLQLLKFTKYGKETSSHKIQEVKKEFLKRVVVATKQPTKVPKRHYRPVPVHQHRHHQLDQAAKSHHSTDSSWTNLPDAFVDYQSCIRTAVSHLPART